MERIIVRREKEFSENEVIKTKEIWFKAHEKGLKISCDWPTIKCPSCEGEMAKNFHSLHTRIVIDRCQKCKSIWCDQGELEMIQIIVEKPDMFFIPKRVFY